MITVEDSSGVISCTTCATPQEQEQEPSCEHRHLTIDSEISGKIDGERYATITLVCYNCHEVRFLDSRPGGFEDWGKPT